MSDILKFACKAPNCGRRFTTQQGLNTHFKLRHPELANAEPVKPKIENNKDKNNEKEKIKEKPSMENIMKQISKTKLNHHEKHNILQPIDHKGLSSSLLNNMKRKIDTMKVNKDLRVYNNMNNNDKKNESNNDKNKVVNKKVENNKINEMKKNNEKEEIEEVEIPNIIEEKQKKLLNNLFGQINSLENYLEKDCEFHKTFTLPSVPDYDKMYDSDDDDGEEDENNEGLEAKKIEQKKEEKNIDKITNDMIFQNSNVNTDTNSIYDENEKYKNIYEINLSKKNMVSFKNKNDIDFTKLIDLYILNLSFNKLSEINDVNYFENLKELYINNNKIEDISFCENLPNLLILNAENNNIINITSLNICSKLKTLKLSSNNIRYLNSTLRTIKNLKKLEDFSIKQNPFLSELFSYREYFISNYPNIKIFDGEILDKEKKIFAETFYKENNPLYNTSTNRPMTSTGRGGDRNNKLKNKNNNNDLFGEDNGDEEDMEDDDEDIFNVNNNNSNDIFSKTQGNFVENKSNNESVNKKEEIENKNDNKYIKNNDEINIEEEKLKKIIDEQNKEINELKKELDKSTKINKDYEAQIERYKKELEEDYDDNDITGEGDINIIGDDNEENNNILNY